MGRYRRMKEEYQKMKREYEAMKSNFETMSQLMDRIEQKYGHLQLASHWMYQLMTAKSEAII